MLANLLRKKGVPASLGAITFLFLLTLGYQSGNPESSIARSVELDVDDAEIADVSYPSPSSYLPDLSKLADSLSAAASSALGGQTQDKKTSFEAKSFSPDVEIARENEGVVVKRKSDDKHSSEGNPCIMNRKAAVPTAWVLVPGGNGAAFVSTTIESIHRQEVPVRALYVDDSSPDGSDEVIRANLRPGIDEFIITDEHCGPSCTKYQGFKHLLSKKLANANDIVIILDADDYFMTDQASKRILQEYTSGEAWITYGSFEGKWAEQVRAVTEEEFKDVRKSTWVYGHPRSFKVGLTKFLYDYDFKDTNGTYFVKASERGFMYRWLELAGFSRTKYIDEALVHYRWRNDNTVLSIPYKVKKALLDYIFGLEPSKPIESIYVIIGVEDAQVLEARLSQLQRQTVAKKIKLNILVGSSSTRSIAEKYANKPENSTIFESITIHQTHLSTNPNFGFERLRIARDLLQTTLVDYILFLDESTDFEEFQTDYDKDYISQLWASRKKHAHVGWRGKSFSANGDFWTNTTPKFGELVKPATVEGDTKLGQEEWHFTNIGGSVIDAGIFQDEDLLNCPEKYKQFDDLWLAYLVQSHGWFRGRVRAKPKISKFGIGSKNSDDFSNEEKAVRDEKNVFLEYLQQRGFGCDVRDVIQVKLD